MKLLVCISHVPDTTSKITFTDNNTKFNEAGVQFIINPYDELALTRAIELTENGQGTTTVINVGGVETEPTIRKALAIGADSAVRVNATPRDAYFVAKQIAEYAKTENFDLILTGRESIDYNGSQVAAMVGEFLNIPSISIVKKLSIDNGTATLEREIEGGKEVVTSPTPLILSASEGLAEPRIPNMRGIMSARTKPLVVIEAVDAPLLQKLESFETPAARSTAKSVPADDMDQLVNLLNTVSKVI